MKCRWSGQTRNAGSFELYGVGESTAAGEPYLGKLRVTALTAEALGGSVAGRPIATVDLAETGEGLFHQGLRLDRELRCRDDRVPGAVLIYSGNNDSGFPDAPSFAQRALEPLLYRSRLLTDLTFLLQKRFASLRFDNLRWWEFNLRRVFEESLVHGLTPIAATAPSNSADLNPEISTDEPVSAEQAGALIRAGRALEAAGRWDEAFRFYREQESVYPALRPFLEFALGRCDRALGRDAEAARRFAEVRNMKRRDNFGRAVDAQNDYVRALAKSRSLPIADADAAFTAHSPHGLVGDELFSDGQHPNAEGYVLLGNVYAAALADRLGTKVAKPFTNAADLLRRMGVTREDRLKAQLMSGRWLFGAAVAHHFPYARLEEAEKRFRAAVAVSSASYSAWFGLALTQAAMNGDFMAQQERIDFMTRRRFYYGIYYDPLSDADFAAVSAWLKDAGAPEATLARVRAARAGGAP